jgi:ribosomal protein L40E
MTSKIVGYVELEWTCPNCGQKNPGLKKFCQACGAPQPETGTLELGQQRELITEAEKVEQAAKGADLHCPYCNTRNAGDAQVCAQCGGDLKEGLRRESGQVLKPESAASGSEVKCPSCGALNPPGAGACQKCGAALGTTPPAPPPTAPVAAQASPFRPWMALPLVAILAICCLVVGFFFFRTTSLTGTVDQVSWERTIAIEAQREVTQNAWRDEVPSGAEPFDCNQKYRSRQDNPAPGAKEVCATEYIDQGNGAAKVVENCYYEVYDDYCKYNALEWQSIDQALAQGTDLAPYWPEVNLAAGQRAGERAETYQVDFVTPDGPKQFTTTDAALFAQLQPGTQWTLTVNSLGSVVGVSP